MHNQSNLQAQKIRLSFFIDTQTIFSLMGNQQNNTQESNYQKVPIKYKQAQLTDTQSIAEEIWQKHEEESNCFCFKTKKTVLKKVDWESKFIKNCMEIVEQFQWASNLIELVNTVEIHKGKYIREVNALKKERQKIQASELNSQPSETQIENFKKNLRKSVIMSFTTNSKIFAESSKTSNINVKKSKLQLQKNSRIHGGDYSPQKSMSNLSKQNTKKSFIQFTQSKGGNKQNKCQISKSLTHELQIFMKFSNILEIHLNDYNHILGKVKSQYIKLIIKKYSDIQQASRRIEDFVDDIKQFLLILKLSIIDFYNLYSFAENSNNLLISNEENILSTCTSIIFKDHQLYNLVFSTISYHFKEQEDDFSKILNHLKGCGPQRFSVKDKFCLNQRTIKTYLNQLSADSQENYVENIQIIDSYSQTYEPFKNCIQCLKEVSRSKSPVNKMKSIVACSQGITKEIQSFYETNCLKKQKWMLDADQVLSIFAYIIVAGRIQHLHTQLFILDNFATGLQMINMTGYYLAVLNCAVQHLQNEYGDTIQSADKA